jgi:DNA-binding MarR family transcriptional regulator
VTRRSSRITDPAPPSLRRVEARCAVTPSCGPGDQPLGLLLRSAARTVRAQVIAALQPLGLGLPDYVCMRLLRATPGMSNAEMARATGVSAQAMNIVLRKLECVGAVCRPTSAPVGRAMPAQLTAGGKALLTRADIVVMAAEGQLLCSLIDVDVDELKQLLAGLASASAN